MWACWILQTPPTVLEIQQRTSWSIQRRWSSCPKTNWSRLSDRARKDIIQTFKDCGLRVTVEILLHQTDFLDVTFDLPTGSYWPFCEPSNDTLFIHIKSNYPPTILKHLPNAICSRLCSISSDSKAFNRKKTYEEALENSGHQIGMEYTVRQKKPRIPNRKYGPLYMVQPDI